MGNYEQNKSIALISMMTALNLIFLLLSMFLPISSLFLMIALPLTSALVSIKVKPKFILIYFIATLLLSFIDIQEALFYVLPSLFSGLAFGYLVNKKIHGFFILSITSIINFLLTLLSISLIKIIYEIDMYKYLANLLDYNENTLNQILAMALLILAIIQSLITYIICKNELLKFQILIKEDTSIFSMILLTTFVLLTCTIIAIFKHIQIAYAFLVFTILYDVYLTSYIFTYQSNHIPSYFFMGITTICLFINVYLFSILDTIYYPFIPLTFVGTSLIISSVIYFYHRIIKHCNLEPTLFDKK